MYRPRRSYRSKKRLLTTIKVTALIAALGFVTVMLEQPRLTASPSHPRTSEAAPLPAQSTDNAATYFPSLFPAPGGQAASEPPTF
jgi:hypothetical protein